MVNRLSECLYDMLFVIALGASHRVCQRIFSVLVTPRLAPRAILCSISLSLTLLLAAPASTVAELDVKSVQNIPPVLLTAGHRKLCLVNVGDTMPVFNLPLLGGDMTDLSNLYGKQATIVLFWHPDRWMARAALTDFTALVKQLDAQQVSMIGIAVGQPAGAVQAKLNQVQATFPQLLDTTSAAFAQVGTVALPRIYVLDTEGKIVWFDIEYSEATRRELRQTLDVLTKKE